MAEAGTGRGERSPRKWRQYTAGVTACLSMVAGGAWFTWPTPILPLLLGPDSPVPMTREQASWMVSLVEIGSFVGCFPTPFIADHFGRKFCILISTPGFLVCLVLTVCIKNFTALCIARFVAGMSMVMAYTILPTYLGEISSPEVRGSVTSMFHIAWGIGCLIPYCVGPYMSYNTFTYFTFGITVFSVLCFSWQPESPYYYAMTGNTSEAAKMLLRLRNSATHETIQDELKEIQLEVKEALQSKAKLKDLFATPEDIRALLLLIIVGVISFLSGQNAILTYTTDTFSQFNNSLISPDNVTLGIGFAALIGSVFSIFTSDVFGRRFLLMFSATGCMISLFIASAYLYTNTYTTVDVAPYSWIAAFSVMAYNLFVTAGMHPVYVTYSSELFPTKTRGLADTIASVILTLCSFSVIKFYESLAAEVGIYFPYLVFALVCLSGLVLFYFLMPETKGKTFAQIREMLEKKKLK